jgi:hypothetical protein
MLNGTRGFVNRRDHARRRGRAEIHQPRRLNLSWMGAAYQKRIDTPSAVIAYLISATALLVQRLNLRMVVLRDHHRIMSCARCSQQDPRSLESDIFESSPCASDQENCRVH